MVNINTAEDLIELLRENQEFREAARQIILTEELLTLPVEFHAFRTEFRSYAEVADKRFQNLEDGQRELKEGQQRLEDGQRELKDGQQRLEDGQHRHTNDIGELKGIGLETKLFNRGVSLIATLLKVRNGQRVRVAERDVNSADFNNAIYEALENDVLSEAEYDRVLDTDMIISGGRPGSSNPVYAAIEASYSVSRNDIAKVNLTAGILGKVFQDAEIHAALYYMEISDAIEEEAVRQGIHLIKARSLLS